MNWPVFITSFILTYILTKKLIKKRKKHIPPERTEKQKQADELITVILPTLNNDK